MALLGKWCQFRSQKPCLLSTFLFPTGMWLGCVSRNYWCSGIGVEKSMELIKIADIWIPLYVCSGSRSTTSFATKVSSINLVLHVRKSKMEKDNGLPKFIQWFWGRTQAAWWQIIWCFLRNKLRAWNWLWYEYSECPVPASEGVAFSRVLGWPFRISGLETFVLFPGNSLVCYV